MFETSQKLLLKLPPEIAHEVAISGLRLLGRLPGRAPTVYGYQETLVWM